MIKRNERSYGGEWQHRRANKINPAIGAEPYGSVPYVIFVLTSALKRYDKMTLYDQIKDDLLAKIKNGTYAVGEAIPSEMQLCDMYGVSRSTIRQAMQALVSEGYLEKRRRRGTVVTLPKVDQTFAMRIMSFEDEMKRAGRVPRTKVLTFKRVKATTEIAGKLELEPGEDVYKLVRLRYADDTPNVFVESYIPCKPYQDFDAVDFEETSLYFAMSESGNPVERARRHLEVSKADVTTAALLDIEEGDPLIIFQTVARDALDSPVEYSLATYRGESNSFDFEVRVSESS
ncbi:GntR family transcriptional regulator [Collinsella sp. TF05-9AC]|uniref:GntR family transcriptional regulator n=1 Tax=Collinsella sp. TF05-9AC TaxID=2292330 RepID=UPI0018F11DB9|nr:GntR family transcriptional regulator [Collinsella sp. TF05-9AC]